MNIQLFEDISLTLGIGGLVLYMMFIMYRLSKESGAGKFGMMVIFFALGLGVVGFAAKIIVQLLLEV